MNRAPITSEDTNGASCPLVAGSVVPSGVPGYYAINALSLVGAPWLRRDGTLPMTGPLTLFTPGTGAPLTAPLYMPSGALLLTPEAGAIERLVDKLYFTISSGLRKPFVLADASLTSGRIPYTTTDGRLLDSAGVLFDPVTSTTTFGGNVSITGNKSLSMSQAAIFNLTRTIPTTVGNYIELAALTNTDFAANIEIWLNVHSNNFAQSKRYFMPLAYNGTGGAWQKALPISTTGAYVGNDVDLEIRINLGVAYFRLRRSAGTTAGIADLVFILGGSADESTWTESTGTGAGVTPTAFYQVRGEGFNAEYLGAGVAAIPFTNRPLLQAGNFPTISGALSLSSWNGAGVRIPFFSACPSHSGGSTPAAAQPAMILGREGVNGQAYANFAEIKLRRYEHSSVNARTAMTIALTHGANASSGTDVLDLKSDGSVAVVAGNLVLPKTQGVGVMVDPASPSFGWRDMLGEIVARGTGAANPTWTAFRGGIYGYQFASATVNEVWTQFHIPHDWLPGTPLYVHVHWAQNVVDTGGTAGVPGAAKWYFELSYADGYGTPGGAGDPFTAPLTVSVVQQGSTTQYAHMIGEVQCGVAGGSGGTMLDTSTIQVDGLILCHLYRDKTDPADTLDQGPFIFMCDMHYQSNGVLGTKTKNFPFYT